MKKDLLQQHFYKSGFDEMQSDALASVFEEYRNEMATTHDMALLRSELKGEMSTLRSELKGEMSTIRSELKGEMSSIRFELNGDMATLRSELSAQMESLKADLTWRFVALVIFLATVTSLVGVFFG